MVGFAASVFHGEWGLACDRIFYADGPFAMGARKLEIKKTSGGDLIKRLLNMAFGAKQLKIFEFRLLNVKIQPLPPV